jgi:hypothetical protein
VPEPDPLVVPEFDPLVTPEAPPLVVDPDEPDSTAPLPEAEPETPLDTPLFVVDPEPTLIPEPTPPDVPLAPVPPSSRAGSRLRSSMPRRFAHAATASVLPPKSRMPTQTPTRRRTIWARKCTGNPRPWSRTSRFQRNSLIARL